MDLFYIMFVFGFAEDGKIAIDAAVEKLYHFKSWRRFDSDRIKLAFKKNLTGYFVVDQYHLTLTKEGLENYKMRAWDV